MSEAKEQEYVGGEGNNEAMEILESISEPNSPSGETAEAAPQPEQNTAEPVDSSQGEESWLIKDKFRNTDEGREALSKAYRELQSEKDKVSTKAQNQAAELEPLRQMDAFMRENPEFVRGLKEKVERDAKGLEPPQKPDDYDIFDESVEGTSSNQWRQKQDEYLIRRGSSEAMAKLDEFKTDIARKEQTRREDVELASTHGLSGQDIVEYRQWLADPNNVNHSNAVKLWKLSNGNDVASSPGTNDVEPKPKQVSAAAVSGASPKPAAKASKETEAVLEGIMQFNRN